MNDPDEFRDSPRRLAEPLAEVLNLRFPSPTATAVAEFVDEHVDWGLESAPFVYPDHL